MMNENMNERQDQIWWIENICDSETDEVKGIVHNFFSYRSNLIFWIVMGRGIADFGRRGL